MGTQFHVSKQFLFIILGVSVSSRIRLLLSSGNRMGTSDLKISTSSKVQQSIMSCCRREKGGKG